MKPMLETTDKRLRLLRGLVDDAQYRLKQVMDEEYTHDLELIDHLKYMALFTQRMADGVLEELKQERAKQ